MAGPLGHGMVPNEAEGRITNPGEKVVWGQGETGRRYGPERHAPALWRGGVEGGVVGVLFPVAGGAGYTPPRSFAAVNGETPNEVSRLKENDKDKEERGT